MPATDSSTHRSLTLPNGLRVALCSTPRLKRSAAALRVAAGSHDVPARWPGLAHFLEHLFFLGTERFPAGQNLMAYVQGHGGQVNASTLERTTDFFFELSPALFAEGLERLCEMLAHPRMTTADQLREREVLHAEFIAWSRDEAARDLMKRLQPLSALHPLRWFHAGNRFSLPVPRQAFQQALRDFYRTFYQAGQMTLSLVGSQTLDELEALATAYGGYFANGGRIEQQKPAALMDNPARPFAVTDQRTTHLIFACEGLPQGHEQAARFLCTWMSNAQPGGLVAELRDRGLVESLDAKVSYEFAGQVLLDIEVARQDQTALVSRMVFSWLTFFKAHYRQRLTEYTLLEQRRLAGLSALPLARHYSAATPAPGLSDQAIKALDALLENLTPQTLVQPSSGSLPDEAFSAAWRLPQPNPFLRPGPASAALTPTGAGLPNALTLSDRLGADADATVYLRWALISPQPRLLLMLKGGLKTLIADAQQAGVTLAFTGYGNYWQLKLSGLAEPLPAVLEQTLHFLARPDGQTLARYGQPSNEPTPTPIRQLLQTLPDHYLNSSTSSETDDLQRVWANARWIGFATGISGSAQHTLNQAMEAMPGTPDEQLPRAPAQLTGAHRRTEPSDSSENAVLLFYPTPTPSVEEEAIWRLFAQLIQAPFYQRLRVELQLGYAVFSGFRQIAGQGGVLLGVQSPSASTDQLIEHIKTFMKTLPTLIGKTDLAAQISALRDQLNPSTLEHPHAAEMLWQAHMAGHPANYPESLQHSLAHLQRDHLVTAASRMVRPQAPWFCLANRSSPRT